MTEEPTQPEIIQLLHPRLDVLLVDSDVLLERLNAALATAQTIAIDAERASGFRYGQKAYLIQIAVRDQAIFLLDTTANFDEMLLSTFRNFCNQKTWIIHAASQDIPCLREYGLYPSDILDTELAGRLLGYPKVSLGTMCETLLHIGLAKEHSAVDWSERPLPSAWLNYAALDVDVLFDLWDVVEVQLRAASKYEIAKAEFDHLTLPNSKPEKVERWRSTTGIHELKQVRQLTVIKSLWEAREQLAKEKDVAPGRLVPDQSLVAAVKSEPKSKSELGSLRSFTGRASRTYLDLWWSAYEHGMQTKDVVEAKAKHVGIPNHRNWASKFPQANLRLQWMRILLKKLSEEQQIPVENLVAPDLVRNLCFAPPELNDNNISQELSKGGARKWQIALIGPLFLEALGKDVPPEPEQLPITSVGP